MTDTINNQIPFVPENTIDPAAGLNLSLNTVDALLQVLVQTVVRTRHRLALRVSALSSEPRQLVHGRGKQTSWRAT